MLLILLWHALYAWDEAMDALFESILHEVRRYNCVILPSSATDPVAFVGETRYGQKRRC